MTGRAHFCRVCDSDPVWRIMRRGDAVVSWACDDDLPAALHDLQRDWEITELVVTNAIKQREWNTISADLNTISGGDQP